MIIILTREGVRILFPADLAYLGDGLYYTDLIVDEHDWNESGVVCDDFTQLVEVHDSILLYRQICHPYSLLLKHSARIQNTFVFLKEDKINCFTKRNEKKTK